MKKLRTLVQLNSIPLSIVHMIVFIGLFEVPEAEIRGGYFCWNDERIMEV